MSTTLCQLPAEPSTGCCGAPPPPPAAPLAIDNAPGLSAIAYRIGTFTSFRRAMLDEVARADLLGATPNPFAGWHEGTDGDYQTLFIELWAYLADILTFYQERIANEAYLGTATQRSSTLRLARLIDYKPGPGAGASGLAAFSAAKGKVVTVPAGFRIGSRAQPGKAAATFETSTAVTARAEQNAIPLSEVAPTNQFAQLSSIGTVFGVIGSLSEAIAADLYGTAAATYLKTLPLVETAAADIGLFSSGAAFQASAGLSRLALAPVSSLAGSPSIASSALTARIGFTIFAPFADLTTRSIVIQGTNTRLAVGDYVLTVEGGQSGPPKGTPYRVDSVVADKTANTTTITWQEPAGTTYNQSASDPVGLYALRVKAGAFGNSAPIWLTLPYTLNGLNVPPTSPKTVVNAVYPDSWDDNTKDPFYIKAGNTLFLDAVYDGAKGTTANPGWIVLAPFGGDLGSAMVAQFSAANTVTNAGYAITSKVTQITLTGAGIPAPDKVNLRFGIRDTLILTGGEALALQNNLPLPDPLEGDTLILAGQFPNLQDGQAVVVQGNQFDPTGQQTTPTPLAEFHTLSGKPLLDSADNLTTVKLDKPLANQYARAGAVLLANVVAFTQGETVKDEILGSGDATPLQSYALKKEPLTYLPSTDPQGLSAVQSTLIVTVNGVRWQEQPTLVASASTDQVFTTTLDDTGQTTVVFGGDGTNGAAPPTGVNNIHARYRKGLGTSGNVSTGAVQQLIDSVAGVQQVTNPQPTAGGADPESIDNIRINAPASVRTFGRAVSAEDYAALALTFPGIAKASSSWISRDANLNSLAQPYVQLTVATTDETPIVGTPLARQLRSFLDKHRDPNVPLRILDFTPVFVDMAVTVDLLDQYPRQATFASVLAALNPGLNPDGTPGYFAFQNLSFGQNLHLSEIYAVLQSVPGVSDSNITTLRRMDLDATNPSTVRTDIFIGPTEIAVIGNDPSHPEQGLLVINQGIGGFVDS